MKFTDIVAILTDRERGATIDLFQLFPWLKRFFIQRRLHAVMRTFGDIVFTLIILSGLIGPQDPSRNCALFLSWGIWWPTVVLSWFFLGRMWCGFCPFPGIGRIFQRLGLTLHKKVPRWLQKRGVYWSVVLLAVILWAEESTQIKSSPLGTSILLLSILAGATICAILFSKQAWCRYLCPMGRIIGVASTLAITEFRPDHDKCRQCKTFACKRGKGSYPGCPVFLGAFNVRNNLYCLVCGHCMKACDLDSPRLNLRSPFKELILNKGRFITCSHIIPLLMGSQMARYIFEGRLFSLTSCSTPSTLCNGIEFSILLLVLFLACNYYIRAGSQIFGITEDELFGRFSPMAPVFVPFSFGGELALRLRYALKEAPDFLPTVGRQFHIAALEGLSFPMPDGVVVGAEMAAVVASFLAALHILHRFVTEEFPGAVAPWRHRLLQGQIAAIFCIYSLLILAGHGLL